MGAAPSSWALFSARMAVTASRFSGCVEGEEVGCAAEGLVAEERGEEILGEDGGEDEGGAEADAHEEDERLIAGAV